MKTSNIASGLQRSVVVVRRKIKKFYKRFQSLKLSTIHSLEKCRIAVAMVVFTLTSIRVLGEHRLFLKKKQKSLQKCINHWELFGRLNLYWNYLSCDLLAQLIEGLSLEHQDFEPIAKEMEMYKKDLQQFMKETKLKVFCEAESDSLTIQEDEPPPGFRKLVAKFNWPQTVTLAEVEKFRRRYAQKYDLQTCAMILNSIGTGSFTVTWFIPVSVVEMLRKKRALTVFKEFSVTRLEIHTSTQICVYQTTPPRTVSSCI